MKKYTVKDLSAEEKIRLLCSNGFWYTMDFDGKLPSVSVSDGPVGLRTERKNEKGETITLPSVSYPSSQLLANTWDKECAKLMGECLADDCYEKETDILLGPGANIKRHPLNGRNFEYFSEDPLLAGEIAESYIDGVQSRGIGACLKHFCCNNLEYNRFEQSSETDERTLREIYYVPFEIACKAKPVSMMSAYNRINGQYASENKKGFKVLREEFGFDGAMYSDWEAVRDRTLSAKAGCDIEFPFNEKNYLQLAEDYKSGKITEEEIDACAERVLNLAYCCKEMQKNKGVKRTLEERLAAAQKIAEESMVLLKNEDGILPVKKGTSVALFGCYAKPERGMLAGDGSSRVVGLTENFDFAKLLKEELGAEIPFESMYYYDKVLGTNGYAHYAAKPHIGKNYAASADINIVCAGTGSNIEAEASDRNHMRLPLVQERAIEDLAAINPNTVVVIFAGSAIDVSAWEHKVKAIIYAGFCGERGLNALCNIICGKVNPSGKLSETFPVNFQSSSVADTYVDTAVTRYTEGLDVGYRYYDRHPQAIRYPFGFGLSYSEFVYSDLKITADGLNAEVCFDIENVSKTDGSETAQVYVQECSPVVYRPLKELKGFAKVKIAAGEKRNFKIKLTSRAFAYYSVADDCWRVNDGAYKILVGSSSRNIILTKTIVVENGKIKF
ncbi:MAG: glycoside hydrolase family 3 C-terminal domain-containing protein [Clostridia bacterium]|nr:glycoside hydrolase family 3 C-terminal domain-containing protein [Clostridia bacterium]